MTLAEVHSARQGDRRYLLLACGITAAILVVEVAGGVWTGSLALLADAGHMLTDLLALLIAFLAIVFSSRPASRRRTWGYHRLEILSAFMNGVLLIGIAATILWEAWGRLRQPRPVDGVGVTAVAAVGLVANLTGVWLLSRTSRSLNVRGALWHLLGDTISSVGVLVAGFVMALTGAMRIDALVSIAIAVIIVYGAARLVWKASDVLLESVPEGLDCRDVEASIRSVDGVLDVRDLHVWSITTGLPALSGHVIVPAGAVDHDQVLSRIKQRLQEGFGIEHSTIQVQTESFEETGDLH